MTALVAIVRVTTRQLLGRRRIIALSLLSMIAPFIYFMASGASGGQSLEEYFGILVGFQFGIVMAVITIVVASSSLGDERRQQTLSFLVVRPLPRVTIAAAKLLTAWLVSFLVTATGTLTMAILKGWRDGTWEYLVPTMVALAIGTLGYAALFMPFGYLVSRATVIGMVYVFLWELAITTPLTALAPTSVWKTTNVALAGMVSDAGFDFGPTLGNMAPGAGGSIVKFLVLATISVVLTSVLLRRRDIQ